MKIKILAAAVAMLGGTSVGAATLTVTDLNLGTNGGLFPGGSAPTLAEATSALGTVGDNSFVGLGSGGSLTFSLDMAVGDGAGDDITFFDPFGRSEGLTVEASLDGASFFSIGSAPGDFSVSCSNSAPCASSFDLAGSGLAIASFFRVSSSGAIVTGFPEAYDFDGIEVLNAVAPVPVPASLPLLAFGLGGLGFMARRKRMAA